MAYDLSYTASVGSTANLSSYTFSGLAIGAADSERLVLVGVFGSSGAGTDIDSVTIGGVAASLVVKRVNSESDIQMAGLYIAAVPTGTTADVVVNFNGGKLRAGVGVWRLVGGEVVDTDFSEGNTPGTSTSIALDVPEGGAVVAYIGGSTDYPDSLGFNGVTEDFGGTVEGASGHAGGHVDSLSADASYDVEATSDQFGNMSLVGCAIGDATPPLDPPTVTSEAVTDITDDEALGNGTITDVGSGNANQRGVVWDTSSHGDPGNVSPGSSGYTAALTQSGDFGTGAFTQGLSPLLPGTTYYARMWAHNDDGWGYGDEVSFTTEEILYVISGVVTLDASPVEGATVRCIRQSDNVALDEQTTDASGAYSFDDLEEGELYHIAVEYEEDSVLYNALSLWDVEPVET